MAGGLKFKLYDDRANFANQFFRINIFFGSGGLGGLYPLPTPERVNAAVRVEIAPRSRVARRVASTVRPCCLMFSKRDLFNLRPWYGRTGPRGRSQKSTRETIRTATEPGAAPIQKKNLYVSMRSAKKSALTLSNGTRPPPMPRPRTK